jgi:hypothetical protein
MPLTNYALDKFVSQQLSQLTECNAPDISGHYSQAKYWVSNFVLNSIFGGSASKEERTFTFFFLRRVEAAFTEYGYARQALIEFASASAKQPSLYFRALHHFEMTIAMLWQAYDLIGATLDEKHLFFKKGETNSYQRLNWTYNKSRHFSPSELSAENINAIWITNSGIQTEEEVLSYSELENLLLEVGGLAEKISQARKN